MASQPQDPKTRKLSDNGHGILADAACGAEDYNFGVFHFWLRAVPNLARSAVSFPRGATQTHPPGKTSSPRFIFETRQIDPKTIIL
jgi:hypothetical protein